MTIARTATDGLREHVTLELESIDRMFRILSDDSRKR